jgi:predicted permease
MHVILDVVLPVFGLILSGFLAGRFGILGQGSTEALNRFVYYFALPPLLFIGMARVPVAKIFNFPFLAAYTGGIVATILLTMALARLAFPSKPLELVFGGFVASYANVGYMGIPLFLTAFGPKGLLPAIIAATFTGSVMIGALVAITEMMAKGADDIGVALAHAGGAVAANPLVIAPLLGLLYSAAGFAVPKPVANFCELIGAAAGPGALFAIGLFLTSQPLGSLIGGRRIGEVSLLILMKLIVYPAITWGLALAVGLTDFWLAAAVILSALPAGAVIFVLATNYGVYVERTSATIFGSTVLSVLTLSPLMVLFDGVRP